jgi:crotonobetainyl-CoA:carnitine CoA-transferase CaiB-like acyl-CoA transferase
MAKVLGGVTVLDMGAFITGPAVGMLLADLGADVIKVEQPETGDPFRAFKGGFYSPHFQTYNRNKRSVTLNTKNAADLATFDELATRADVFIQNFRPGVAERLSVGHKRLQALNPALIYCSISGFGPDGPEAERPAFDTVAQAASGFLRLLINPKHPRVVGPAIGDAVTGFYGALGVLAALHERNTTGRGRLVETSMFEAMCHFNLDDFTHYLSADEVMGPFSRPHVSQSYVFECADGLWLALHMSSPPKFWENLAEAVGLPEMLQWPECAGRIARIENYETIRERLAPIFKQRTRADWCAHFTRLEVPHAPLSTPPEVLDSAQARHLQLDVETRHPTMGRFRTIRSPLSFDGERSLDVTAPPVLGEHNEEIIGPRRVTTAAE